MISARAGSDADCRGGFVCGRGTTTPEVFQDSRMSALVGADVAMQPVWLGGTPLFAPLLVVDAADLERGPRLFEDHPELGTFDAVLAAAALTREASALVSADDDFRVVRGLRFVMPGTTVFDNLLVKG